MRMSICDAHLLCHTMLYKHETAAFFHCQPAQSVTVVINTERWSVQTILFSHPWLMSSSDTGHAPFYMSQGNDWCLKRCRSSSEKTECGALKTFKRDGCSGGRRKLWSCGQNNDVVLCKHALANMPHLVQIWCMEWNVYRAMQVPASV